jgi:hypothetical protein
MLSIADIRSQIPTDNSVVTDELIQQYINIVTEMVNEDLDNIFPETLPTVTQADCINYFPVGSRGLSFISIGAWQPTGLTFKITDTKNKDLASLTETALVLGTDYTLWYGKTGSKTPGKTEPVTAIKLLNKYLGTDECLRVYGTYGWSTEFPNDIKPILIRIISDLASEANSIAQSDGVGGLTRIKSLTVELEQSEAMAKEWQDRARSLYNDINYSNIIASYKAFTAPLIITI